LIIIDCTKFKNQQCWSSVEVLNS